MTSRAQAECIDQSANNPSHGHEVNIRKTASGLSLGIVAKWKN